jgi:type II secretory pathway predicted ATPase ExeA
MMAGGRPEIFEQEAILPLFRNSAGIPREINRICHNALALAARQGRDTVSPSHINSIPAAPAVEKG